MMIKAEQTRYNPIFNKKSRVFFKLLNHNVYKNNVYFLLKR